jgi:hypothetical protein
VPDAPTPRSPRRGGRAEVGVLQHDARFAAELERQRANAAATAWMRRPVSTEPVKPIVDLGARQTRTAISPGPWTTLTTPSRYPCLEGELLHEDRRHRCLLSGLEHHRVRRPSSEEDRDECGPVPRRDDTGTTGSFTR